MKKFLVTLFLVFALIGVARAEVLNVTDLIKKIPNLKQGIAYSFADKQISYLSTFDILTWKKISFEAGYSSDDKVVAVISYPLVNLKTDFNVTLPILDLINCRIGVFGGYGRLGVTEGNNEFVWGVSATILELKF